MRTVAAFFATVLIAVPAGWHLLGADIQTDGPATRPKLKTLQVDGVKVSVELDRGVLMAGGTLKATLIATSDTPKTISLDVRAMEDMGIGEERVSNPPQQVGRRRITIESAPDGGKRVDVAFKLGERGRKGVVHWFDIEVTKAGVKRSDELFDNAEVDEGIPMAARVGAATWNGNSYPLAIELPAVIPADQPFTVAVRLTNTTKKQIDWLNIELGGKEISYGGLDELYARSDDQGFDIAAADDNYVDAPVEPGKQRVAHFVITPTKAVKEFTVVAHAQSSGTGALEVLTFKPTALPKDTAAPTPVATK